MQKKHTSKCTAHRTRHLYIPMCMCTARNNANTYTHTEWYFKPALSGLKFCLSKRRRVWNSDWQLSDARIYLISKAFYDWTPIVGGWSGGRWRRRRSWGRPKTFHPPQMWIEEHNKIYLSVWSLILSIWPTSLIYCVLFYQYPYNVYNFEPKAIFRNIIYYNNDYLSFPFRKQRIFVSCVDNI